MSTEMNARQKKICNEQKVITRLKKKSVSTTKWSHNKKNLLSKTFQPKMIARQKKNNLQWSWLSLVPLAIFYTKKLPSRRVNAACEHVPGFSAGLGRFDTSKFNFLKDQRSQQEKNHTIIPLTLRFCSKLNFALKLK